MVEDIAPTYWLFGWLDSQGINDGTDLKYALGNEGSVKELREVAEAWSRSEPHLPPAGINLIAGTGLRLDDDLTCPNVPCRCKHIDVLFRHAWHYFDSILLPDAVGHLLLNRPSNWKYDYFLQELANSIASSMYIRDLGATPLVWYYPKLWKPRKTLTATGGITDSAFHLTIEEIESQLIKEVEINFVRKNKSDFRATLLDPLLGIEAEIDVNVPKGEKATPQKLQQLAAYFMMHEHLRHLMEDLHFREAFNGTLGLIVWTHERALSLIGSATARDVMLKLSLPSISEIPVRELIAIRLAEGDSFAAFRATLTKAALDIMASSGSDAVEDVSQAVVDDVIRPELARLTQRLRAAKRSLRRKTAMSLALGAVATKCGVLMGVDPTVAGLAGIGTVVAGSGRAGERYIEEKQVIEISDMYFLWKALGHAE